MVWVFYGLILSGITYGIAKALTTAARDNAHNRKLRVYLEQRDAAFKKGIRSGRAWLAALIADAEYERDLRSDFLKSKKHPAKKSAVMVAEIKAEKKALKTDLKLLEYQLKSYEEYFPFLLEYRDVILDETIPLHAAADNLDELEQADPAIKYLSSDEWKALPAARRSQIALARYIERPKANWEIGRFYERYLGYLRERQGWAVNFHGALKGFEDLGRDLICRNNASVEIIQAKCWSVNKTIHEKHVFQLFGTTLLFRLQNPSLAVLPVLAVTTQLSHIASVAAMELGIRVDHIPLRTDWPMIKCNVSTATGEQIYHLPFDQQYDRVRISSLPERYVQTVAEAEAAGFRRAWRFKALRASA